MMSGREGICPEGPAEMGNAVSLLGCDSAAIFVWGVQTSSVGVDCFSSMTGLIQALTVLTFRRVSGCAIAG